MQKLFFFLQKYSICGVKSSEKAVTSSLPLALLPLVNLLPAITDGAFTLRGISFVSVLLALLWVCVEEIVFRGVLPAVISERLKLNAVRSALIASALFALFHFVNILDGESASYALVQSILAFGVGFSFSALVYRCKSILPGIAIHFLFNFTADLAVGSRICAAVWIVLSALCAVYGLCLFHHEEKRVSL